MAIAIAIVAAAASGYMAYEQSEAQKAQQKAYNEQLEAEAIRQYGELDAVENDTIYESHAESLQAQREYMTARSEIELKAAATGTYGNSVNTALADLRTGFGSRMSEITYRRDAQLDQVQSQAEAIQAGVPQQADRTIMQPSWYAGISTGIRTGTAMYSMGSKIGGAAKAGAKAK